MPRPLTRRQISHLAWQEYKITKATAGNASEALLASDHAPSGFVAVELGFGLGEGPSLSATMQNVEALNRKHAKQAEFAVIKRRKSKRESGEQKQARLQSMIGGAA